VLAGTTLREATGIAERVRATIAATPLALADGRQIALTASLGVASTETGGERTLEALIGDADAALYQAKAAGRNCVVPYHPLS
jgi:diguanylate cyclase (GGDEF)-like protein